MVSKKEKYPSLDPKFAQLLVDIVAAELSKNVNICDHRGVIIASFSKERISQLHEATEIMLGSGKIYEFSVSAEDEINMRGVRKGFNVPIIVDGRCLGVIGVTGEPEAAAPYARLAARFVQAALESNARQEKLVRALSEKEELQSILLNKIIDVQEEERKKISRELHDETSQALTSIIVGLRMLSEQVGGKVERDKILGMRKLVAKTLDDVHRLALELRPVLLDDLGLVAAAQRYIQDYSRQYDIAANIDFAGLSRERFRPEIEITLYRILQETLTNIAKHAQATQVRVSLKKSRWKINLAISDNGVGFNADSLKLSGIRGSLGIYGMRERVALLEGKLDIQSSVGVGTTVTVEIPLTAKKESADGSHRAN
jgi:two-component system, NarL family, sensor histidine kinase NreB